MTTHGMHFGRHALVTGGSRGIGRAIVERLLADGAEVTFTSTTKNSEVVLPYPNSRYHHLAADFSADSAAAFDAFLKTIAQTPFDILINNAGINKIGPFAEIALADFEQIQRVNLTAPFRIIQAVLPHMKAQSWGRIINIASIWSLKSKEQRASYSASKFALDGLTAALSAEVAKDGILANAVSPGFIDTELTRSILSESAIADLTARVPMQRLGQPSEVAALVSWLASSENSFISGQNIAIDGGFTRA